MLAVAPCLLLAAATDAQDVRHAIVETWHVKLVEQGLAATIVPLVAEPNRPVSMADLSSDNAPACLASVQAAFRAYPASLVSSLVQTVALADAIQAWDIRIGGFHAPGLLAVNCESADTNAAFDVDSIHDEMAALMLAAHKPDWAAWQALNPAEFRYGDEASYKAELREPGTRDGTAALQKNGFVSTLGLTGKENDFQTYSERIFGHGAEFATILRSNPAMRGKARMVMALYATVAPELTAKFRDAGLMAAAVAE